MLCDSGCLSCYWVGFPPAPRCQLLNLTNLCILTTLYHFVPHLISKSFSVKQKLEGLDPTPKPVWENTSALWLTNRTTTRDWVYTPGSFAIFSLRFFLTSATGADFPVEIRVRCGRGARGVGPSDASRFGRPFSRLGCTLPRSGRPGFDASTREVLRGNQ
jgi:hypothetical protein